MLLFITHVQIYNPLCKSGLSILHGCSPTTADSTYDQAALHRIKKSIAWAKTISHLLCNPNDFMTNQT